MAPAQVLYKVASVHLRSRSAHRELALELRDGVRVELALGDLDLSSLQGVSVRVLLQDAPE